MKNNFESNHLEELGKEMDKAILEKEFVRSAVEGAVPEIVDRITDMLWEKFNEKKIEEYDNTEDEKLVEQILKEIFTDSVAMTDISRRVNQSLHDQARLKTEKKTKSDKAA